MVMDEIIKILKTLCLLLEGSISLGEREDLNCHIFKIRSCQNQVAAKGELRQDPISAFTFINNLSKTTNTLEHMKTGACRRNKANENR